jgi:hypothetical protein
MLGGEQNRTCCIGYLLEEMSPSTIGYRAIDARSDRQAFPSSSSRRAHCAERPVGLCGPARDCGTAYRPGVLRWAVQPD